MPLRISPMRSRRLAWGGFIALALTYVITVATAIPAQAVDPFGISTFAFPLVGILILTRQPRNTIGWILLAIGAIWGASGLLSAYGEYGLRTHPGSVPGADVAIALSSPMWAPAIGVMGVYLLLLFPDGRLSSPRWRMVAWLGAIGIVGAWASLTSVPGPLADSGYPDVTNPLGIDALQGVEGLVVVFIALIPISIVASAVSLVQRFRRSAGTVRLQLKWLTAAAAIVAAFYALAIAASINTAWGGVEDTPTIVSIIQNLAVFSFALIPIAIGFAILRHRLYDIDVIINRALVYSATTAAIAIAFFAGIVVLQAILRPVTSGSELAVAASTLASVGLFQPLRRRMQATVDHRFYRSRYDAARTLDSFAVRLRDEIDLDALRAELIAAVGETVQPTHASLWLKRTP